MPRLKSLKLKFAQIARFLRFRDWITFRRPSAFKHEARDYDLWKVIKYCGTWRLLPRWDAFCKAHESPHRWNETHEMQTAKLWHLWIINRGQLTAKMRMLFMIPISGSEREHSRKRLIELIRKHWKLEIELMQRVARWGQESARSHWWRQSTADRVKIPITIIRTKNDSQPPQILLHLAGDFRWEFRSFSAMNSRARLCWWMINHNSRSTATIHRLFCFAENPHITSLSYESVRKKLADP